MRQPLNPLNPLFNNVENREILKVSSVIFQHYEIKGKVFLSIFHHVQNQASTILDCIGF